MRISATELNQISKAVQLEAERRKYKNLYDFFVAIWPLVEGSTPFKSNWHLSLITDHIEAMIAGEFSNLLINIPPGCSKSLIVSVAFPVFGWTVNPEYRFFTASYSQELATRDAVKSRAVIESSWFKERWGSTIKLARGQTQKTQYQNTEGGSRTSTSVGGRGTGMHPDWVAIDDPHSAAEAQSDAERQSAIDWWDLTISSRGVARGVKSIIVMQRLHENDLSGHIMASPEFNTEWEHLCLPMRFEPHRYTSTIGSDPRTETDELLWPELFTPSKVKTLSAKLGEYGDAGQLQQRPSPPGGGILKIKHFQLWPAVKGIPALEYIIQSWDTAFKEVKQSEKKASSDPDPSANTTWGIFTTPDGKRAIILLDSWDERVSYPKLRSRVISNWGAYYGGDDKGRTGSRADVLLVEDKASGQSLLQDLHQANIPAIAYNPGKADKTERAHMIAPLFELDCVYIMESSKRPGQWISWAKRFISQVEKFPNDKNDDLVDTFTQALLFIKNNQLIEMPTYVDDEDIEVDYSKKSKNPYG